MEKEGRSPILVAVLVLFWPLYLFRFLLVEMRNPAESCFAVWTPLDDVIPFCEWFLIPYLAWYAGIVGIHLYTFATDVESFKRYSVYLLTTAGISTAIFLLFPTCQNLRPENFPRDNLLTEGGRLLYAMDTNTNVLPSEHVTGAIGVYLCAKRTRGLDSSGMRCLAGIFAGTVCLSTVFLKQHSVLDVLAAMPVSAIGAWIAWGRGIGIYGKTGKA